jgi:hypothetical protein
MTGGHNVAGLAGTLLRGGLAVFTVGLIVGLGLLLRYFYVTPFVVCAASLAEMPVIEVWSWAVPLLAVEAAALAHAAFGLLLLAQARQQGPQALDGGSAT